MTNRAAVYVDGFNAYHAIDRLNQPHLKWLDWHDVGLQMTKSVGETLVSVTMCTAVKQDEYDKRVRHETYLRALESKDVICLKGHFADDERTCRYCTNTWLAPVEKQGDVNLAISIINDAHLDQFDHCYVVTADGDQVATVKMIRSLFPNKKITSVVIEGQIHNKQLLSFCDHSRKLSVTQLERSLFPKLITGAQAILRPAAYDPPIGWVHPKDRPQKTKKK